MRARLKKCMVLMAGVLVTQAVGAAGIDLHRLWDDRCAECHGHAGDFARRSLNAAGIELQGHHHVHDLRRFLHNHYLAHSEVDAVYSMLLSQAGTQARFRAECSQCHDTAAEFVRTSLELHGDVLVSRDSGRPIRSRFLEQHSELNPDDVEFFLGVLTRVAREIYRP